MAALSRRSMIEEGAWSELENVDLRHAELDGLNLSRTCFVGSNLEGASLAKADLTGTTLSHTVLRGANLSGADLRGAELNGADLTGVITDSARGPWVSKTLMPRRQGGCRRSIPAVLCRPMTLNDSRPLPTFCPQMIKGLTAVTSDQALDLLLRE
jgi:uncharacterized protein YjbI with pentapeptide repeats